MKIQETTEYRIVKQLTAKENKEAIKKGFVLVSLGMAIMYGSMLGFFNLLIWVWNY